MSARLRRSAGKGVRVLAEVGPRPGLLAAEVTARAAGRVRRRRLRSAYHRLVATPPGGATLSLPNLDLPPADALPAALAHGAALLRLEAEDALAHRFDVLGSGTVELGPAVDWHADFTTGHRWPLAFYQDVPVRQPGSDPKVPWELSRGHHLLTLARAARLFGDERYADGLESSLVSWLDANPPGLGINWTCPMEVAIRAVNWIFALSTVEGFRRLSPALRERVVRALQVHGRHVAANLEGTPLLRGNHYLADVSGLFVLGCVLRGDAAASRWRRAARRALEGAIRQQVHEDGVGFEASLPYHGLALELFLVARAVAGWAGVPFSGGFDDRLGCMLAASAALRHPSGRMPQFGDCDSGRVLPAGTARPATHDSLLWLGAAVIGRRHLDGNPDPEVAWTLGLDAWRRAAAAPAAPAGRRAFPAGGAYVLTGGGTHCVVRCGGVGQNGRGGHAHNDLLSFELSLGGVPVVVDRGTYCYTSDPDERDRFRSTAFHSTVRLDGQEQRPLLRDEVFRLPDAAAFRVEEADVDAVVARLTCAHDGYLRLDPPAAHRRTFELDRASGSLAIRDRLAGEGARLVESFLHLAPGTRVRRLGDAPQLALERRGASVELRADGFDEVEVVDGVHSEQYGVREPAPVVVARAARRLPCQLGFVLVPSSSRSRTAGQLPAVEAVP
jgi:hypothetical protein